VTDRDPGRFARFLLAWVAEFPKVAANLTAAFALFLCSLAFAPVRNALFGVKSLSYPLACSADPVRDTKTDNLDVEFFIVNPTDDDWTDQALQEKLNAAFEGSSVRGTVELPLLLDKSKSPEGRIVAARNDDLFNDGKGEIKIRTDDKGAYLTVLNIAAHSVLRAVITIANVPGVADRTNPVNRLTRIIIPLDYKAFEESCFGR
jgi:hypothetical protein